jgi:hypothetical protein
VSDSTNESASVRGASLLTIFILRTYQVSELPILGRLPRLPTPTEGPVRKSGYFSTWNAYYNSGFLGLLRPQTREQFLWGNTASITGEVAENLTRYGSCAGMSCRYSKIPAPLIGQDLQ